MSMHNDVFEGIRGCLLAGAIGDAMGGPFEGQSGPLQYREHSPWAISDDTQLTLATCESIIEAGHVSAEHIASRFLVWFRERRITGIGASTLKAMRDLDAGAHWALAGAHWALAGARGEMSAGNGAAMRIAPLAFHLDPKIDRDRQTIRDVCRITHHNDEAYVGALAIVAAIRSSSIDNLLPDVIKLLPDSRVRDRIAEFTHLSDDLSVCDVGSQFGASGYVVESVPLALYAARLIARLPLADVLRAAIEAGGDTDTIASMAGHVAGAWLGGSQIPDNSVQLLPHSEEIERIAKELGHIVQNTA